MTDKQEHLLVLLREIDEICKKHQLRYVMAGGSLIGVVRNEGFIPWDDDVDIYMPKADWDRFVELSRTEFPPDRAVQCVDVDREFTNTFPRYADTASCAIHKHQLIGNDKAGEIIDVLTLDPIPADDKEYEKYRTHMMIYSELVNVAFVYGNRWEIPVTKYIKYLLSYHILGRDKTLKKLENIMYSYKEEDCDRYAMRWGGCPFLFEKDMMFPVKYREFEGIQVMVPQRISDYLIWHYGDEWSYIPPHEERSSHDAITVDGITYEELRSEYMKKVDAGKIRRDSVLRKIYYLAAAKWKNRLRRQRNLLQAKAAEMDLEARIRQNGQSLMELAKKHEFAVLNEIFSKYYQVQLSAEFIGREDFGNIYAFYHPVLLNISDEAFLAAMLTLVYTERVAKAWRMLQLREQQEGLIPEMQQLKEAIVLFRKAACHYERKEKMECESICRELLAQYPDVPGFLKMYCRPVMERAMEQEDDTEAEAFLAHALELFPEDGYFLKYKGDLALKREEEERALTLYADAREKTNNGITHLEIEKYLRTIKKRALMQCRDMIERGKKEDAYAWAELWQRLLPEDEVIRGYGFLVKAAFSERAAEWKSLQEELEHKLAGYAGMPKEKYESGGIIFGEAMEMLLKRRGYPQEPAKLRIAMLLAAKQEELEEISVKLAGYADKGIFLKLTGDIQMALGCTDQAFAAYGQALELELAPGIREEITDIILEDLCQGAKKARSVAKRADAAEYMNHWLGKYGSLQQLQTLAKKLAGEAG